MVAAPLQGGLSKKWRRSSAEPRAVGERWHKVRRMLPHPVGYYEFCPVFMITGHQILLPEPRPGREGAVAAQPEPPHSEQVEHFVEDVTFDEGSRRLRVRGWAVRLHAPLFQSIPEVALVANDGKTYFLNTSAVGRPDVAAKYGDTWAHNCGFWVDEVVDGLPAGEYRLGIRLRALDPVTAVRTARRQLREPAGVLLPTRRQIRSREDLRREVDQMTAAKERSLLEWLAYGASFEYVEDVAGLPEDPLSPEYRQTQLELFFALSGRSSFDPSETEGRPVEDIPVEAFSAVESFAYPYRTRSPEHIGNHYLAMGHILRVFGEILPTGSSVLEYGSGEGFSTVALGSSGYSVTAVDIDAYATAIVDLLAKNRDVDITAAHGQFGAQPEGDRKYDAVFFYEAFHHCLDFVALLEVIERSLRPGGYLVLAGEPILADFPKPWGLRLDGGAVWEICTNGWLELGFRQDFFLGLLAQRGWETSWRTLDRCPDVLVCKLGSDQ